MSLVRHLSRRRCVHIILAGLFAALVLLPAADAPVQSADQPQAAPKLELQPGDHISILGNTLADRMQHDGWLETYFQSRFPQLDLVFRNLGFSADEVTMRLQRSATASARPTNGWSLNTKTDVVFAFFGYNESFAGEAGLDKFKKDLDIFVKYTVNQKYNGKSNARLVLFSPIAHEDLHDPNLPDGKDNNKRPRTLHQSNG